MTDYMLLVAPSGNHFKYALFTHHATLSTTENCCWGNCIELLVKGNRIGTVFDYYKPDEVTLLPLPSLNIDEIKLLYPELFL